MELSKEAVLAAAKRALSEEYGVSIEGNAVSVGTWGPIGQVGCDGADRWSLCRVAISSASLFIIETLMDGDAAPGFLGDVSNALGRWPVDCQDSAELAVGNALARIVGDEVFGAWRDVSERILSLRLPGIIETQILCDARADDEGC